MKLRHVIEAQQFNKKTLQEIFISRISLLRHVLGVMVD